jgi:hypothetical protein
VNDPGLYAEAREAVLLAALGPNIEQSVDDLEVAVLLERAGVDDAEARRLGAADCFALARRLRADARRRIEDDARGGRDAIGTGGAGGGGGGAGGWAGGPAASPPRPDWYPSAAVSVLRGLVFTLGALTLMVALGQGQGDASLGLVLIVSTIGVTVTQPLAFLGYLCLERSGLEDPASLRPLLWAFLVPLAAGGVTAVIADAEVGLLVAAALAYLVTCSLLLTLGHTVLVAVLVLPVAVLATIDLLELADLPDRLIVVPWLAACGVLVAVTLAFTLRRRRTARVRLGVIDLRASLPFAAVGLVTSAVVIANLLMVADTPGLGQDGTRDWVVATLPFLVPVALAEALVVWVRRGLHQATARVSTEAQFRRGARRRCAAMFAALLATGVAALALVVPLLDTGDVSARLMLCGSFLLLGVLLTASLLLMSADALRLETMLLGLTAVVLLTAWAGRTPWTSDEQLTVNVAILAYATLAAVVVSVRVTTSFRTYR